MTTKTRPQPKSPGASKTSTSRSRKTTAPSADAFDESSTVVPSVSREHIATRAYVIWQQKGCPEGCDEENWQQAEQELRAQSFTR